MRRLWKEDEARLTRLLLAVFSIFGVATFTLKHQAGSGNNPAGTELAQFASSKLALIYSVILIWMIGATNYLTLQALYLGFRANLTLFHMLCFAEMIFGSLVSIFIICEYCLHQKESIKLATRLCRIRAAAGTRLLSSAAGPPLNAAHTCIAGLAGFYFVLTLGLIGLACGDYESLIIMLSSALREFVIIWLLLQYALVVRLILGLFQAVNAALLALDSGQRNTLQLLVKPQGSPTQIRYHNDRQLQTLSSVHELHASLFQITGDIVKFYELTVFGCIAYVVVCIVVFAYVSIAILVERRSPFPLTFLERLYFVLGLISYVMSFIALARFVTQTVEEIDKTGIIVHQLIRNTLNTELSKELEDFSLYLLHTKVKFTAWGFFEIDGSLVQSIFSSITTYLVIVIQFQLGSASKSQS